MDLAAYQSQKRNDYRFSPFGAEMSPYNIFVEELLYRDGGGGGGGGGGIL